MAAKIDKMGYKTYLSYGKQKMWSSHRPFYLNQAEGMSERLRASDFWHPKTLQGWRNPRPEVEWATQTISIINGWLDKYKSVMKHLSDTYQQLQQ